jgi:hypothetical protein
VLATLSILSPNMPSPRNSEPKARRNWCNSSRETPRPRRPTKPMERPFSLPEESGTWSACPKARQRMLRYQHKLRRGSYENLRDHSCGGSDCCVRCCASADHDPNVVNPGTGLATLLTFTTTTCMMGCNSQASNCRATCVLPLAPTPPPSPSSSQSPILNATANTTCMMNCSSVQMACQSGCALNSPSR